MAGPGFSVSLRNWGTPGSPSDRRKEACSSRSTPWLEEEVHCLVQVQMQKQEHEVQVQEQE